MSKLILNSFFISSATAEMDIPMKRNILLTKNLLFNFIVLFLVANFNKILFQIVISIVLVIVCLLLLLIVLYCIYECFSSFKDAYSQKISPLSRVESISMNAFTEQTKQSSATTDETIFNMTGYSDS